MLREKSEIVVVASVGTTTRVGTDSCRRSDRRESFRLLVFGCSHPPGLCWVQERQIVEQLENTASRRGRRVRQGASWMETMVSHHESDVSNMENPAECLGESVAGVDDPRDVTQYDLLQLAPLLKSEVADFDVAGARSGSIGVNDLDGGFVVFPKGCRVTLWVSEVDEDTTKVFGYLGGSVGGDEFRFAGILSRDGLALAAIYDQTSTHGASIAGGGSHSCRDVAMGGVHVEYWLRVGCSLGHSGESGVRLD